jgi:hypothetical protein
MCNKKSLFPLVLSLLLSTAAFGQQLTSQTITSEMIGPFSGGLSINYTPPDPCSPQSDNVGFTGNVHVVAIVNTTANTVDYHVNLLSVKGAGTLGRYVGTSATSFLDQPLSTGPVSLSFAGKLTPPDPCREGFVAEEGLPVTVTVSFAPDSTVSTVSASVGCPPDICVTP